ncbi:MAG: DNA ligase (NAD(+)) LigA, partial [Treponema sp.]|nr:DNA ligase (NAD(+)) LigA [Treponema sp.]
MHDLQKKEQKKKKANKKSTQLDPQDARIAELEAQIAAYQKSYYNGEAEISDEEYDRLWDELKQRDPENPTL